MKLVNFSSINLHFYIMCYISDGKKIVHKTKTHIMKKDTSKLLVTINRKNGFPLYKILYCNGKNGIQLTFKAKKVKSIPQEKSEVKYAVESSNKGSECLIYRTEGKSKKRHPVCTIEKTNDFRLKIGLHHEYSADIGEKCGIPLIVYTNPPSLNKK